MIENEVLIAIIVPFIVAMGGIYLFIKFNIWAKLKNAVQTIKGTDYATLGITSWVSLILVGFTYIVVLSIIIIIICDLWSDISVFACMYAILLAPFVMLGIALANYKKRLDSRITHWLYYAALIYVIVFVLAIVVVFLAVMSNF
ncbi:hypothetical protein [Dysgonomonas sp. 511]|uniref:hypothetical protein n=1 Tax=Dysgonomonas sp. 511 TaxID=2302930 RepID=UPI0013D1C81A|nr:hypothetical protein [Dysgonomonas sp. 511]NDV77790.1 hypothetical protein [Dysgonomonas sp. 511]